MKVINMIDIHECIAYVCTKKEKNLSDTLRKCRWTDERQDGRTDTACGQ